MPQSLSQGSFIKIHTTRRGNKEEERIEEEQDNKISFNLSRLEKYQEKLEGKKIEREKAFVSLSSNFSLERRWKTIKSSIRSSVITKSSSHMHFRHRFKRAIVRGWTYPLSSFHLFSFRCHESQPSSPSRVESQRSVCTRLLFRV